MEDLNLSDVLGWGYCDVDFLNNRIKEFDINSDDIKDEIESFCGNVTDINSWIYSVFYIAANNFLDAVETYSNNNDISFNRDDVEIEIFCNYLDSFLNGSKLNSEIDVANLSDDNIEYYLKWLEDK